MLVIINEDEYMKLIDSKNIKTFLESEKISSNKDRIKLFIAAVE